MTDLPLREDLLGQEPYGAPTDAVPVRLNVNENPYAPPAAVVQAMTTAVTQALTSANRYPDRMTRAATLIAGEVGRLGVDRLAQLGRPWEGQPKAPVAAKQGCQYFGETQHLVCDQILSYWSKNGLNLDGKPGFTAAESLALFGLPITEAAVENGSDGKPYLTQWFERARFEYHPEVGPNAVLLGLLGREVSAATLPPA